MNSEMGLDSAKQVDIEKIKPARANPRAHPESQLNELAESIRRFGFRVPVLIDERGYLLAGHARTEAAKRAGLKTIPAISAKGWSKTKRREYLLFDNQISTMGRWDAAMMKASLQDLLDQGTSLAGTGFTAADIAATERTATTASEQTERSKAGDIYQLGKHRIMCGDSTDSKSVAALFNGGKPELMVTDPPYGIEFDPDWRRKVGRGSPDERVKPIEGDHRADWKEAYDLFPGGAAYIWYGARFTATFFNSIKQSGFNIAGHIVWVKNNMVISRGCYQWKHEACIYATRAGKQPIWRGGTKESNLWFIDKPFAHRHGHSTEKPVDCMGRPIRNSSNPGGIVYDPFLGSGTTLIAAEQAGRTCYAMELDPLHIDNSLTRWEAETGEQARKA